jgi:hypothetical protein
VGCLIVTQGTFAEAETTAVSCTISCQRRQHLTAVVLHSFDNTSVFGMIVLY